MKKLIILIAITAVSFSIKAQDLKTSDVPDAVKTKFASLYPNSREPNWEKENGKFEAEFKLNNLETSVLFEADGTLIQTETEISVSSLPAEISDYVTKNLSGNEIKEASKIVDVKGNVTYEAEVEKTDYIFDANGNLLEKEDEDYGDSEDKN